MAHEAPLRLLPDRWAGAQLSGPPPLWSAARGMTWSSAPAERSPIAEVRWSEWARRPAWKSSTPTWPSTPSPTPSDPAVASYRELLRSAAPTTTRHEVLLTVVVSSRRVKVGVPHRGNPTAAGSEPAHPTLGVSRPGRLGPGQHNLGLAVQPSRALVIFLGGRRPGPMDDAPDPPPAVCHHGTMAGAWGTDRRRRRGKPGVDHVAMLRRRRPVIAGRSRFEPLRRAALAGARSGVGRLRLSSGSRRGRALNGPCDDRDRPGGGARSFSLPQRAPAGAGVALGRRPRPRAVVPGRAHTWRRRNPALGRIVLGATPARLIRAAPSRPAPRRCSALSTSGSPAPSNRGQPPQRGRRLRLVRPGARQRPLRRERRGKTLGHDHRPSTLVRPSPGGPLGPDPWP